MSKKTPTTIDADVPVKGALEKVPFARIVRAIASKGSTGSLYLLSGKTKKVVFFEEGRPVFVRSNVLAECLGQVLVRERLITQEQCDQTLEAIRRTGKKQGELLVEMGVLSEGNLRYALETQLRIKLYDVFAWTVGRYQFKPGPSKDGFRIRIEQTAEDVVLEAVLERIGEKRARKLLEPLMSDYPRRVEGGARPHLLPEERHFLRCLDGGRTVAEILASPPNDVVPRPASLLYALLQAGLASLEDTAGKKRPYPPLPKLKPDDLTEDDVAPRVSAVSTRTEFEDTPPPGPPPTDPELMGDDDFDIDDMEPSTVGDRSAMEDLVAAEPEVEEEVFEEDEVEILDEDALEMIDEDEVDEVDGLEPPEAEAGFEEPGPEDPVGPPEGADAYAAADVADVDWSAADAFARELGADPDDLLGLDELAFVALRPHEEDAGEGTPPAGEDGPSEDVQAAMHFSEGEEALAKGDFERAASSLERAYELGVDVPELHAMLAYARFAAAPNDPEMQQHALDLLAYAEEQNPDLDIVHAYRGAVLRAMGDPANARLSLERALEINPYCDVAIELMDSMG